MSTQGDLRGWSSDRMVDKTALRNSLEKMSDRETIFNDILTLCNISKCHFVTCRDKSLRYNLYTIDVEAATCLDIAYCHRYVIRGVDFDEFCHSLSFNRFLDFSRNDN